MKLCYIIIVFLFLFVSKIGILLANDNLGMDSSLSSNDINLESHDDVDYYSAENIYKFADYLYQERDYARALAEYEHYLSISQDKNDIVLYRLGFCYRNVGNIDGAVNTFQKLRNEYNAFAFPASYQIAYSYFASNQNQKSVDYINNALKEIQNTDEKSKLYILSAFNFLMQRQWTQAIKSLDMVSQSDDEQINRLAFNLRESSIDGVNFGRKSRILASIMSAIIPGTGKMYCGQYGNGIYSFATVTSTGLVALRGFGRDGIQSIKGWIFGSLCTIFYAGNIYGSGISALAYNRQMEDEILMRLPLLPSEW